MTFFFNRKHLLLDIGCLSSICGHLYYIRCGFFGENTREANSLSYMDFYNHKMPKNVEINLSMNNSSALVAPTRSEIRIELPTIRIMLPTRKQVLEKIIRFAKRIVYPVSLLSTITLSAMSCLEIYIPVFSILLAVLCALSSNISFFLIFKEMCRENEDELREN